MSLLALKVDCFLVNFRMKFVGYNRRNKNRLFVKNSVPPLTAIPQINMIVYVILLSAGVTNVKYYCAKAEDVIHHLMSSLWSKDVVAVVDPPRAGLRKLSFL